MTGIEIIPLMETIGAEVAGLDFRDTTFDAR